MEATERNDIWNPTSHRVSGLMTSIIIAAKASVLSDVVCRWDKAIKPYKESMVAERMIEGDIPVNTTYNHTVVRRNDCHITLLLRRDVAKSKMPKSMLK